MLRRDSLMSPPSVLCRVRAGVLESPGRLVVQEIPRPTLDSGEVLVRIEQAGVCGSDRAVFLGKRPAAYPLILGHEGVGVIADAGSSGRTRDERVVIEPNIPCGTCTICKRGRGNVCPFKQSLGLSRPGAFAEYVAVPSGFAHALPDGIELSDAVGIEPLAVALHALKVSGASARETVAIVGCGAEGLLLLQVAVAAGIRVVAVDVRPQSLELAQTLGAGGGILAADADDASRRLEREWCPEVVFESAGAGAALEFALRAVAPGGRVVALGLDVSAVPLVPLDFVRREIQLIGSLIYDHPGDFRAAIEMVRRGQVRPSRLVSRAIVLDDLPAALAADSPRGKTLVTIAD